jgi:very-short-patch-repair endonuclease
MNPDKPTLLPLVKEYRFCERRWRFDMANIEHKIAIEIEGGAYTHGRHTRGAGFIKDMEKYNYAAILGWKVLRYTPQQFKLNLWIDDINKILNAKTY